MTVVLLRFAQQQLLTTCFRMTNSMVNSLPCSARDRHQLSLSREGDGHEPNRPPRTRIFFCALFFSLCSSVSFAQTNIAAVLGVLISSSPETNSLGGIAAFTRTDDPLTMTGNAGILGLQSLNHFLGASTLIQKTLWLPPLKISDLTYSGSAVNAGIDLAKLTTLPFPISVGMGYAKTRLDLGRSVRTENDPSASSTVDVFEQFKTWYVGIGFEYFVRGGIGIGFKNIESNFPPIGIANQSENSVRVSAHDWGAILEFPFGSFISTEGLVPVLNLNLGYAVNNIGGEVTYPGQTRSDPLPRQAQLGSSGEFGFRFKGPQSSLTLLSLTIAREARTLLVSRNPAGAIEYQSGLGEIGIGDNLIRGHVSDRVESRKAWQLDLLDIFFLRRGSFAGAGYKHTTTSGFGIKINPLLNIIRLVSEPLAGSAIFGFFAEHVDLQYNYSTYSAAGPLDGTQFKGLVLIVK